LELGGKNPCIIDETANLKWQPKEFGKFINAGQTCIAPDYIMIQKDMKSKFIDYMITAAYSNKPEESLILLELSMLKIRSINRDD
jgi:aldehyde dehydrogenase (NAD+)